MKKMMMALAALAALCVAGAAGAVSLDWTTSGWTPMGEAGREDGHGITADSAFGLNGNNYGTFVLVGSLKSTSEYTWVTEVWGRNAGGDMQNYVAVGIDNGGNWAIRNNQGWGNAIVKTINTVAATAGAYVIGFSMVNEEGTATATVTVSVNGTEIATIVGGLTGTTGIVQMKWADAYVTPEKAGVVVGGAPDCALSAEDIAALPEPTALALLALGVAGLALRRKAA